LDRANAIRFLAGAALLAASLAFAADVTFKTARIKVGAHPLKVEVADSEPQRMQGLMFRKKLGANDGMLFVFDELGYHGMRMKNSIGIDSAVFVREARKATRRALFFSSSVAATMPRIFFWLGQMSTHTLNSMMRPSQAPMPMGM